MSRSAFEVRWSQSAAEDLDHLLTWVADSSSEVQSAQLFETLDEAVMSLGDMPTRCRVVPELRAEAIEELRELLVGPYRVVLTIRERRVYVLGVLDGRRDLSELLLERALQR